MSSNDNSQLSAESWRFGAASEASDEGYIPGCEDNDLLASLLATASGALQSDRRVTQRCIERAAALLGIGLRAREVGLGEYFRPQNGLAPWQVNRLRSYIDERLDTTIRVDELANLVRLSTSHFFRAFRRTFGESPITYVTKRRIRRAQELMLAQRSSLAQVALECGMCDQAHFSRTFRRIVGTNPTTWRRMREPRANLPDRSL